ncbi:DUF1643 domain-containing protein [Novosphingobium sp.]|uniref:DUF1643 domain-containing protein n=1 Tax=Novosphingobium sp. TaxID=1874826 RepID=UPI003704828E
MSVVAAMSAVMSPCETYRYRLERDFVQTGPTVAVFMVNPSWADAQIDDNTITRLVGFGKRLGWGKLIVGNVFAKRTEDVNQIGKQSQQVEDENLAHVTQIMRDAQIHIVAWGTLTKLPEYLREKWRLISETAKSEECNLQCFGTVQSGHPRHPGRISYDTPLRQWTEPTP